MRARPDAGQLSLVGVVIALVVVAALSGIGLAVFVGGSDNGGTAQGPQGAGVGTADNIAAQESLSQAQTTASTAGVAGGYGTLGASALASIDPSVTFTSGASTSSSTVSVAPSGGSGATGSIGGGAGTGLGSGLSSGIGAGGAGGGSVTMAAHSKTGTCWYLWLGSGGPRYGAQTGQSSCQAEPLTGAPAPSGVTASAAGWSSTGFPQT